MRIIRIFFLGIFSIMFAGCLASDKPTPIGEQGETIHLLGVVGVHESIVDSIEKKMADSHIKIDKNFYYWDTYQAKARMAIMNNTREYDVILGPCSQLVSFINADKAVSLKDIAERAGLEVKDLYQPIQATIQSKGDLFCLPYLADALIFIYRTDLYKKAGLTPPRTIKEMYTTGKKLTNGNNWGLAFPAGPGDAATSIWSYFLWSYGGEYFDSLHYPTINSAKALTATYIYNQILSNCAPLSAATWQTEDAINYFANGHLASMILWSGASKILDDKTRSKVAGKIGYALLPAGEGGKAIPRLEAWGVFVPRSSQHIIAAKKFCEVLVNQQSLKITAKSGIVPTPIPKINMRFVLEFPESSFAVATKSLAVSRERPNLPEANQFIPVISSALNDILMGADLKMTLDGANHQIKGIMQLNGRYK